MKSLYSKLIVSLMVCVVLIGVTACQFPSFGKKPPCGQSVLKIGETTYQIKDAKTESDGSLKISANTPNTAYWVNQTETNQVFALSPTSENLKLQNANPDKAVVTWANCNSSSYTLSAPQAGMPAMNTLLDQSNSGITIFVQNGNDGFVIHGEFVGENIQAFNTPDLSAIQAEISLLGTIPSADKKTIKVSVSILNSGQKKITLTSNDVSLLIGNTIAKPLSSEPVLPKEIAPSATEKFSFTFAYPNAPGATLKVFDAEYDVEGY